MKVSRQNDKKIISICDNIFENHVAEIKLLRELVSKSDFEHRDQIVKELNIGLKSLNNAVLFCKVDELGKNIDTVEKKVDKLEEKSTVGKCKDDICNIEFADFIVRTYAIKCIYNHNVEQIQAKINIMKSNGELKTVTITAAYCKTCKCYFILESDYQKIKQLGVLLCQQITEETYRKNGLSIMNGEELKPESLLHQSGYNVSASEDLSSYQRQEILRRVVDNGLYTVSGICSHLDWLIGRNKKVTNRDMSCAIAKWEEDRAFIFKYKANTQRTVGIKSIKRKV